MLRTVSPARRKRPPKLDRYASRTAVGHARHGTRGDREVKRVAGPKPEYGPCQVFLRGEAMTRAIINAARQGRRWA